MEDVENIITILTYRLSSTQSTTVNTSCVRRSTLAINTHHDKLVYVRHWFSWNFVLLAFPSNEVVSYFVLPKTETTVFNYNKQPDSISTDLK